MGRVTLVLKLVAGAFAFLLYVWFAAVRLAPRAKRRRALRRAARAARARERARAV